MVKESNMKEEATHTFMCFALVCILSPQTNEFGFQIYTLIHEFIM